MRAGDILMILRQHFRRTMQCRPGRTYSVIIGAGIIATTRTEISMHVDEVYSFITFPSFDCGPNNNSSST